MQMEQSIVEMTNEFYFKKLLFCLDWVREVPLEVSMTVWLCGANIHNFLLQVICMEFLFLSKHIQFSQDTILLVDKGQKKVSSSVGHNLMNQHPFAEQRFVQANENLTQLADIMQQGDLNAFMQLVETEALSLHAMMMTANPYFILMQPRVTLSIIKKIWEFRAATQVPVFFTLDAGANVHVLYPKSETNKVISFIDSELSQFCENKQYICDEVSLADEIPI